MADELCDCPSSEQLKLLLDGTMAEADQAAMQAHVDGCAACQKTLESLVVGTESWDAAVGHLRDETPQPSLAGMAEAIDRLKQDEFIEAAANQAAANVRPLDFLEPSDQPGSIGRLGVYEVSEVVGQGGMGVVLKAFDPSLHRVVAVKVLAPYLAHNPQARRRFIREAQAIAAVSHDHVITIHAIDESAEQPKIVMQFIAGRSLQQRIDAEGSLDLKEILRIGMQTAAGLAAAHAQGLVHRDVKPSNILLENGIQRVKLTDFGLARAVDDASLTQSGVIAGTPQYMAPEQANGDAVDYRADLFSLGSVLYAMCVGHSPFRASTTMGVLKRVCHDPARPIQELNPDIPDWLCAIIMKLLAKKPDERFSTAKSVAEVLEQWLAHVQQPMVVPKPSALEGVSPSNDKPLALASATASSPSNSNQRSSSSSARDEARRFADSGTILFQPISGRLLLFLLLTGMAVSFAVARSNHTGTEEALMMSVLGGMFICFWGMLFVALVRLVWANLYGSVPWVRSTNHTDDVAVDPNDAVGSRPRRKPRLPPESLAMLIAIGVMFMGVHPFLAAIIAIVVWRIATHYSPDAEPQLAAMVGGSETRVDSGFGPAVEVSGRSFMAQVNSVRHIPAILLQRLGEAIGSVFDLAPAERNRLLIAIMWCLVGGFDLVGSVACLLDLWTPQRDASMVLLMGLWFGLSLLSFAVSQCVYSRQNYNFVRGAAVVGLFPLSVGAFIRIPLSIISLLWLHAPAVKESFATTPWPETDLGRLVGGQWSPSLQRGLGTFGRIAAWSVLCLILLILTLACYVIPFGPSDYQVYDFSAQSVMSKGNGPPFNFSMMATGTGRTYGLLPPAHVYLRDSILLTAQTGQLPAITNRPQLIPGFQIRLGYPATTNKGGQARTFTREHCQELFQEISGKPHPQHADSLFETIQKINAVRDSVPSSLRTPAEQFQSGLSISIAEWMSLLSRTFLHAEPLHANRPLPGFAAASTLLNEELFKVRPGPDQYVSNSCMTAGWLLATLFIGFPLVWLLGVWRIVRRWHWKRTVISDSPSTTEV